MYFFGRASDISHEWTGVPVVGPGENQLSAPKKSVAVLWEAPQHFEDMVIHSRDLDTSILLL